MLEFDTPGSLLRNISVFSFGSLEWAQVCRTVENCLVNLCTVEIGKLSNDFIFALKY